MIKKIRLKRGLDIPLIGKAQSRIEQAITSRFYTIFPDDYPGFIPKITIQAGDSVQAGTPLLYDKNRPEIKIVSPVSGVIMAVNRGEKRKLQNIVIEASDKMSYLNFGPKDPLSLSPEELKAILCEAGLFALIKQRPYNIVANPADKPRDIFVSAFYSAPLAPKFALVLSGFEADFQAGLDVLTKLTDGTVYVSVLEGTAIPLQNVQRVIFKGPHPAGNVGVQINNIQPINKGETVWTVLPQDVIVIGRLFNKGITDFTRLAVLTGSEVKEKARAYYPMLPGVSIAGITSSQMINQEGKKRYISGNVLTGTQIEADGSLHASDNQITIIPEGDDTHEVLGWILPRFNQFSFSKSYPAVWLNRFFKKKYHFDARIKGGQRAMILSNEWDKVFPMDILPEFLIRAILSQEVDKMEDLGIYEVAPEDFALCEYVDTSKMELQKIVKEGLDWLYKEMN
ncbi:Na(+)-translocating NADH-quinone reductase subunit A [Bacteroidia bacterium]|nr:Na(+)-translocating NADH-quinone reductase subunit A [Bacteroidia bacterium]